MQSLNEQLSISGLMRLFQPERPIGQFVTAIILLLLALAVIAIVRNLVVLAWEFHCLRNAKGFFEQAQKQGLGVGKLVEAMLERVPRSMMRRRVELLHSVRQIHALTVELMNRMEQHEQTSNYRFARFAMSVMLVLGLLGTVIGLSISIQGILPTITAKQTMIDVQLLLSALRAALDGLETAFSTTLTALACTFVLAVMVLANQRADAFLKDRTERFLTIQLMPKILISSEMDARSLYVEAVEASAKHVAEAAEVLDRSREGIRSLVDGLVDAMGVTESRIVDFFNFAQTFKESVGGLEGFVTEHATQIKETYDRIDQLLRAIQEGLVTDKVISEIVGRSVNRAIEEANRSAEDIRTAFKADIEGVMSKHEDYVRAIEGTKDAIEGFSERTAQSFDSSINDSFSKIYKRFEDGLEQAIVQQDIGRLIAGEALDQVRELLQKTSAVQEAIHNAVLQLISEVRQFEGHAAEQEE